MAAATLIPPTLPECDGYDAAVLLDQRCYVADRPNATTASAATSTGLPIQVTFHAARPPLPSYLCVHCPGLDFHRSAPRVVATDADLVLLRVPINPNAPDDVKSWDFFLYRPRAHKLDLLPNPHPRSFHDSATALLSHDSGACYAVAAISNWSPVYETETNIIRWEFQLHLYRSYSSCDSEAWITMPMSVDELVRDRLVPLPDSLVGKKPYHDTAKTITIGGERGSVAWVDLWRGVLLCDVLVEPPVIVHDIPLPVPARGNWGRLLNLGEPNYIRDVAISRQHNKDTIKLKYIEMEIWSPTKVYSKAPDSYLEWVRWKRSVTRVIPGGWKARTWSMAVPPAPDGDGSSAVWQPDCQLSVKDVTMDAGGVPGYCDLLSKLSGSRSGSDTTSTLQRLQMAFPTISIDDDDDIVYLASSTKHGIMEDMEFIIAVDVRNKTLRGVTQLDVKKHFVFFPTFYTSEIRRYLSQSKSPGAPVQLKRTEKEVAKPTEKEAVKLTGKKESKPTRVHADERTSGRTRPPVNKRVMKTLEKLQAINWSCPRRLGEQMKDADNGDRGAC